VKENDMPTRESLLENLVERLERRIECLVWGQNPSDSLMTDITRLKAQIRA
jgi:hypothetical protein